MTSKRDEDSLEGRLPTKRLPYEKPAIEETSEFETLALGCNHSEACNPEDEPGGIPSS